MLTVKNPGKLKWMKINAAAWQCSPADVNDPVKVLKRDRDGNPTETAPRWSGIAFYIEKDDNGKYQLTMTSKHSSERQQKRFHKLADAQKTAQKWFDGIGGLEKAPMVQHGRGAGWRSKGEQEAGSSPYMYQKRTGAAGGSKLPGQEAPGRNPNAPSKVVGSTLIAYAKSKMKEYGFRPGEYNLGDIKRGGKKPGDMGTLSVVLMLDGKPTELMFSIDAKGNPREVGAK